MTVSYSEVVVLSDIDEAEHQLEQYLELKSLLCLIGPQRIPPINERIKKLKLVLASLYTEYASIE